MDINAQEFNEEISQLINETNNISFANVINISSRSNRSLEESLDDQILFDESSEYDFNPRAEQAREGERFNDFSIKLGTNDCPRFSCACHKNNIAVRMAIKKCKYLLGMGIRVNRHF